MLENKYQYRNLPCENNNWYIAGTDSLKGIGILEWCLDKDDAHTLISNMRKYDQFYYLRIEHIHINKVGIPCDCDDCYKNIKESRNRIIKNKIAISSLISNKEESKSRNKYARR